MEKNCLLCNEISRPRVKRNNAISEYRKLCLTVSDEEKYTNARCTRSVQWKGWFLCLLISLSLSLALRGSMLCVALNRQSFIFRSKTLISRAEIPRCSLRSARTEKYQEYRAPNIKRDQKKKTQVHTSHFVTISTCLSLRLPL